jgi:transcriptional regulator with XRE-family HTH domain
MHEGVRSRRHDELARFLTSRRANLDPESCGLPPLRRRRRTPGLRRDEVSALAGISTAYYTWIEQGRRFDVSSGVLEALAVALRLNDVESTHLFTLAGKSTPRHLTANVVLPARGGEAMLEFVRAFREGPALLLTPWLEVAASNARAGELLDLERGTNLAEAVLCGRATLRLANADRLAGAFVALLRRNYANDVDNERFDELILNLRARSDAFRRLWDAHVITGTPLMRFEIRRRNAAGPTFEGMIVADPLASHQFGLFMSQAG